MPVFDGLDIPALEWCTVMAALAWIVDREPPLEERYRDLVPLPPVRITMDHPEWERARRQLFHQAYLGKVPLTGFPLSDEQLSAAISPAALCDASWKWLKEAGNLYLVNATGELEMAYCQVMVDFRALAAVYPPPAGETLRIGGDVAPASAAPTIALTAVHAERGRPGPRRVLRDSIKSKMLAALRSGQETPETLKNIGGVARAAAYGGGRYTADKAFDEALSEFAADPRPPNSDK